MKITERIASYLGFSKMADYPVAGPSIFSMSGRNSASSARPGQGNIPDSLARYADQAWLYSAIRIIQTNAAEVPLKVYKMVNGKKTEIPNHPLKTLLDEVNPFMDGYGLREGTHGFKELTGNAFWLLDAFINNRPSEIYPLNPAHIKPLVSEKTGIVGYEYRIAGKLVEVFTPEEILHFRYWNPNDPFWGLAPWSAGRDAADLMKKGDQWNISLMDNSAEAGGFLTTEKPLTGDQISTIKTAWAKNHQGARKAHKIEILHGGMDWKETTMTHHDMMYPELKRMSREELLTCYQMPPVMVGVFDEANYSNAEVQERIFWKRCVKPRLRALDSVITERLGKPFDDVIVEHDTSGIGELQEDQKMKAERDQIHTTSGIKTINEVRAELKLPPVPWGDTWNAPMGLMPIDTPRLTHDETPPPDEDEDEEDEDKAATETAKAIPAVITKDNPDMERRDATWARFKIRTETHERRWFPILRNLFSNQEREVIDKVNKHWETTFRQARLDGMKRVKQQIDVLLFDFGQALRLFRKSGEKLITFTLAAQAAEEINQYGLGIQFDITNSKVFSWIREKTFKFANEVNQTTLESLRSGLEEAITKGETITEVQARVEHIFDIARSARTEAIARTEVIGASNKGAFSAYQQAGITEKEWVSSRDAKVRDEHQIDGEVTGIESRFSNKLLFPGDPNGSAENVINCRCTIAPVISEEA